MGSQTKPTRIISAALPQLSSLAHFPASETLQNALTLLRRRPMPRATGAKRCKRTMLRTPKDMSMARTTS